MSRSQGILASALHISGSAAAIFSASGLTPREQDIRPKKMVISQAKSKVMHIHRKTHVSSTTEAEVEALKLAHKCDACSRTFPTQRGMKIHAARWCDGGVTQRSRRGSLADRAVQTAKRRAAEALLSQVYAGNTPLENVYSFEYLGARMQCDGTDDADVRYRMAIAQTTFGSLSSIWTDHRLSRALKLRTYQLAVCSTLTHASEAWTLTEPVMRSVNGFNSRCLPSSTRNELLLLRYTT